MAVAELCCRITPCHVDHSGFSLTDAEMKTPACSSLRVFYCGTVFSFQISQPRKPFRHPIRRVQSSTFRLLAYQAQAKKRKLKLEL